MFATMTAHNELSALSHQIGSTPKRPRKRLRMPLSASIIHCHVVADTMIGSRRGDEEGPRGADQGGKFL